MSYFEDIRAKGRDANPFFRLMGIDIGEIGKGEVTLTMEVRADMQNGEGRMQGGIFTALAGEAMVLALSSLMLQEESLATISESTTFLKGARDGLLVATGRVVRKGRRVAFAESEVRMGGTTGDILARCTAAFAIVRKKE
jgi:acyl-CoA thioesterase